MMKMFRYIHQNYDKKYSFQYNIIRILLFLPRSWIAQRGGVDRGASGLRSDEVGLEMGIRGIKTCSKEQ